MVALHKRHYGFNKFLKNIKIFSGVYKTPERVCTIYLKNHRIFGVSVKCQPWEKAVYFFNKKYNICRQFSLFKVNAGKVQFIFNKICSLVSSAL